MNDFGIYIGRFQPFHNAHKETVNFALTRVKKLIIVIGSDNQPRTIKNPWTTEERIQMISSCFSLEDLEKIEFVAAKDYLYNNNLWLTAVQQQIEEITGDSKNRILFGHDKDASSFYLHMFNVTQRIDALEHVSFMNPHLNATHIREVYFGFDTAPSPALIVQPQKYLQLSLPGTVFEHLNEFRKTSEFALLKEEYDHVTKYKEAWQSAPYPPTFVTTDAVVIKSGHVLVVRRKAQPGKGLIALPGGFLNQTESVVDGCVRELKEETRIKMSSDELKSYISDQKVFDHPNRSLRGRTITHAFCINLGHGPLPQVKGSDDAEKAFWLSFADVARRGNEFYEDHASIIEHFIHKF